MTPHEWKVEYEFVREFPEYPRNMVAIFCSRCETRVDISSEDFDRIAIEKALRRLGVRSDCDASMVEGIMKS